MKQLILAVTFYMRDAFFLGYFALALSDLVEWYRVEAAPTALDHGHGGVARIVGGIAYGVLAVSHALQHRRSRTVGSTRHW